jgi:hypothetical protein
MCKMLLFAEMYVLSGSAATSSRRTINTAGSDICLGYAGKVQGKSKLKHVIAFQIVELDIGRSKT